MNGLGVDRPFESGPPGDVYSWFYDYSPDLDQFVTSSLLEGFYPKEYLRQNLDFLRSNASLAVSHGLVPGLHINSPRSMPEEFWQKYPFLRGARIDHPRESFRPRYTLAMAHPAVQQHYRELVRSLLKEVPQIGFIHIWTNDSGSGFEYVSSLYAGRNGGPYLLREWKRDDEIARAAAANVLSYYRLLRDEARGINPECRIVCDLGSFSAERKYIVPQFGGGLDAGAFGSFEGSTTDEELRQLKQSGGEIHVKLDLADNNVLGLPFPSLVYERLQTASSHGALYILTNAVPRSLAPYDINGEVLRSYQEDAGTPLPRILEAAARVWVGEEYARQLTDLWLLSDEAVRAYPAGIPYSTFAFPWFRLWIRPFVPDIDSIPEAERSYYEQYLLATFNNPARVDLNNDMMWNFLTVSEARELKNKVDQSVLPPLTRAIEIAGTLLRQSPQSSRHATVFGDLRDRLRAARCFFTTMRNSVAWTEAVHGFLEATTESDKAVYGALGREMVSGEIQNANELLRLWNESPVNWMPVAQSAETLHLYGPGFGEQLRRKISLMERHIDDVPRIDPEYMWRIR